MFGKQKILIVDDDENIAELISLYLTKECFDTKLVYDGEDALAAFDSYQPNLPHRLSCFRQKVKYLTKFSDWNSEQMIIS